MARREGAGRSQSDILDAVSSGRRDGPGGRESIAATRELTRALATAGAGNRELAQSLTAAAGAFRSASETLKSVVSSGRGAGDTIAPASQGQREAGQNLAGQAGQRTDVPPLPGTSGQTSLPPPPAPPPPKRVKSSETLMPVIKGAASALSSSIISNMGAASAEDYQIGQLSRRTLDSSMGIQNYRDRLRQSALGTGASFEEAFQYSKTSTRFKGSLTTRQAQDQADSSMQSAFGLGADRGVYQGTVEALGRAGAIGGGGQAAGFGGGDQKAFAQTIAETLAKGKLFDRLDEVMASMSELTQTISSRGGLVDPQKLGDAMAKVNMEMIGKVGTDPRARSIQERAPQLMAGLDKLMSGMGKDTLGMAVYSQQNPQAGGFGIKSMVDYRRSMEGGDIEAKARIYSGAFKTMGGDVNKLDSNRSMIASNMLANKYGMTYDTMQDMLKVSQAITNPKGKSNLDELKDDSNNSLSAESYRAIMKRKEKGSEGTMQLATRIGAATTIEDINTALSATIKAGSETEQTRGGKQTLAKLQNVMQNGTNVEDMREQALSALASKNGELNLGGNRLENPQVAMTDLTASRIRDIFECLQKNTFRFIFYATSLKRMNV
jgi:hypothetical protein